jgi:hypothetical protein
MRPLYTRFLLLLVIVLAGSVTLSAQRDCGSMELLEQQIQQDPTRLERLNSLEKFTEAYQHEHGAKALTTIPVVFHIVYNGSAQNISQAQINSQIQVLNDDFRRLNADADNVWSQAADSEVEFCLATVAPSGNATDGVIRTSTTRTSFGTNDLVKSSGTGGSNAWPAADYMNVWVCNIGGGILGYAQFPGGPASTDGVVCDYRYFGTIGTATAPFDLGRTMTHEVGHYLNLRHIWGDGNCNVDDFVSDTPNASGSNGGCQIGSASCNSTDMVQNYMDYSDDACMNLFTAGQASRMQASLASSRSSLSNSNGCGTPGGGGGGGACNDTEVSIDLTTDQYASETTWTLTNASGSVVASNGSLSNNTSYSETLCLPDGCYTFTINDSYGDGICCTYGNGSYGITNDATGADLGSGGSFASSETQNFCIGGTNPPTATCDDGVQNGDETGVDCGGNCAPCDTGGGDCTDTQLTSDGFESNYGNWNDGGSDCVRSRSRPITGARSVYLRDNTSTSVLTSDALNLSDFEEVTVDFSYYPYSMENGEDFWLQVDNGNGFQTVQTWARGTDFNNNTRYDESVTITGTFGSNVRIRFRCDASGNSDYVHLDNIVVGGCTNGTNRALLNGDVIGADEAPEADDFVKDINYSVFPNPAREAFNVTIDEAGFVARLTSLDGRVISKRVLTVGQNRISTENITAGMYLLIIEDANGFREVEKVIVQ